MLKTEMMDYISDFCSECGHGKVSQTCTGNKAGINACPLYPFVSDTQGFGHTKNEIVNSILSLCRECLSVPEGDSITCEAMDCSLSGFWREMGL